MSKFELTISPDYRPNWGVTEGVREFIQNSIDEETVHNNRMYYNYDESTETFTVGNYNASLDSSSLLLGATTKLNNSSTIGQFGEGYKIGTLALIRAGKNVVFHNPAKSEEWSPRFVNSRRYNSKILTFFINKSHESSNGFSIEVSPIDTNEYEEIKNSVLIMKDDNPEVLNTSKGNIILDKNYSGDIYVKGLFVTNLSNFKYGYDFNPDVIHLDIDRKLVNEFDLKWTTSIMWKESGSDLILDLAKDNNHNDVEFISNTYDDVKKSIIDKVYDKFIEEHGSKAIPVSDNIEMKLVSNKGYIPIIVSKNEKYILSKSDKLQDINYDDIVKEESTKEKLEKWIEDASDYLPDELYNKFNEIIDEL